MKGHLLLGKAYEKNLLSWFYYGGASDIYSKLGSIFHSPLGLSYFLLNLSKFYAYNLVKTNGIALACFIPKQT